MVRKKKNKLVADVEKFPGHIACDSASKSEIVVPVFDKSKKLIAVLDIDSSELNTFDETDQKHLEKIASLFSQEFEYKETGDIKHAHLN